MRRVCWWALGSIESNFRNWMSKSTKPFRKPCLPKGFVTYAVICGVVHLTRSIVAGFPLGKGNIELAILGISDIRFLEFHKVLFTYFHDIVIDNDPIQIFQCHFFPVELDTALVHQSNKLALAFHKAHLYDL